MWELTWRCASCKNFIWWKKALEYLPCYTHGICSNQAITIFTYVQHKIWPCFRGLLSSVSLEHALIGFNKLNFMEIWCFPALWKPPETSLFIQKGRRLLTYQKATPLWCWKDFSLWTVHSFHSVFSLTSYLASSLLKKAKTILAWKFLWRVLPLLWLWEMRNTHLWKNCPRISKVSFHLSEVFLATT